MPQSEREQAHQHRLAEAQAMFDRRVTALELAHVHVGKMVAAAPAAPAGSGQQSGSRSYQASQAPPGEAALRLRVTEELRVARFLLGAEHAGD